MECMYVSCTLFTTVQEAYMESQLQLKYYYWMPATLDWMANYYNSGPAALHPSFSHYCPLYYRCT